MKRICIIFDTDMTRRQQKILSILFEKQDADIGELIIDVEKEFEKSSKVTIIRDLNKLILNDFIRKSGLGKATKYSISPSYKIISPIDVKFYFEKEPENRNSQNTFNFDIFNLLENTQIFVSEEKKYLESLKADFNQNIRNLSETIIKKEFERITIELSWKSSAIEGNTYSLLETENLIKEGIEAKGKKREESIMILNHKKALDFIRESKGFFSTLKWSFIEKVHEILTANLNISKGIRKTLVGITGTDFKPLDNEYQIKEATEKTLSLINKTDNIFSKSLLFMLLLSYIQPFEDGNKRTSRIVGNAILLAGNSFPISFRTIDEIEYKKAVLLFYEQNNISYFKKLFIEQAKFSAENYFRVRA